MDRGRKMGGRRGGKRGEGTWEVERGKEGKRREEEGEQVQEKRPQERREWATAALPLTTSSMTGSGLAASSCSLTFSSTRGHRRGGLGEAATCLVTAAAATAREEGAGRPWGTSLVPLAPSQPDGRPWKVALEEGCGLPG